MGSVLPFKARLYMDRRDVTGWCSSLTFRQDAWTYYAAVEAVFRGWHSIPSTARWDLYATYDGTVPRSELVLRGGVVAPDSRGVVQLAVGDRGQPVEVVQTGVTIVDWAWLAQRRSPPNTIVVARTRHAAQRAVEDHDGPVGSYTVITGTTVDEAVVGLASLAGFRAEVYLPRVPLSAMVLTPPKSYWECIWTLVEPYRPDVFFRRVRNAVVIADPVVVTLRTLGTLDLSADVIAAIQVRPRLRRILRRLLLKVR